MFIGHFSLAFAAKKLVPKTSLATLMVSVGFVDILWPVFLFFGWEHVRIDPGNTAVTPLDFYDYPISHSLVASLGWALVFGLVYRLAQGKGSLRAAVVLGLGVLSHWFLDFFSHKPDMPLLLNEGPLLGLGLWNSVPATLIVETTMFGLGIWIYLHCTRARNRIGRIGLWGFVGFLYVGYLINIFGPPPPSIEAIQMMGPMSLILFGIPYWVDQNRESLS